MNGWRRIGIVVFAIWTLVATGWAWKTEHSFSQDSLVADLIHCQGIDSTLPPLPDGFTLDHPTPRERCQQAAKEAHSHNWTEATNAFLEVIPFAITIPALLVWGAVSLVIVTTRWVKKGFERP